MPAWTLALTFFGSRTVMLPLTVRNSSDSVQVDAPTDAPIDPFTVTAAAVPVVSTAIRPLTVSTAASLRSALASMLPFTVFPKNRTPSGTLTVNSTLTSLSFTFMCPALPGRHSFGSSLRPFREDRREYHHRSGVGYTAQTVTLPSSCTTCTETLFTSLRRAVFVAVTSTWLPEVNSARMLPLTPLISMAFPRWTVPDH